MCRLLGECDVALATNSSCMLTAAGRSGELSECSKEGVSNGTAVAGIGKLTSESETQFHSVVMSPSVTDSCATCGAHCMGDLPWKSPGFHRCRKAF